MPAGVREVLVFAAASVRDTPRLRGRLAKAQKPFVVAADHGAATALALGFHPDLLVGDFDSIDPALIEKLTGGGTSVERHPRNKDATDGQLALESALRQAPDCLLLVGFLGGTRLDHSLANVLLLATLPVPALLLDSDNEARLLRDSESWMWSPEPGELISLLPLAGDALGVSTHGLRFRLDEERLLFGHTRGISNEPDAEQVGVSLERGRLLVTRHFPPTHAL